jgi:hypothetical protein
MRVRRRGPVCLGVAFRHFREVLALKNSFVNVETAVAGAIIVRHRGRGKSQGQIMSRSKSRLPVAKRQGQEGYP